jgi:hypothetical protein
MALIAKTDLERRVGAGELMRYARNDENNILDAIADAENRMRSEAVKVFTSESWDEMSAEDLPRVAGIHLVSDAIDLLSAGSNRTAGDEISKKSEEARLFRIRLANNEERCFDGVLTFIDAGSENGRGVSFRRRDEQYFRRGKNGVLNRIDIIDPEI